MSARFCRHCFSRHLLGTAIAAACLPLAHADTQPVPLDDSDAYRLETMLVTATRTEFDLYEVLASATVVDRAEIERLQTNDVMDLLKRYPALDFSRAGGPGAATSLFLRGTNSEHSLVMLDGQRIASATNGAASIQFIDPEALERVEIVRGPRSSLYGSDALGGVVQFFTRTPGDTPGAYIKTGVGRHGSERLAVGGEGRADQWRFGAYYSYFHSDGIDSSPSKLGYAADEDVYRNNSLILKGGYDFANGGSLDLSHFYTEARKELDVVRGVDTTAPYGDSWLQGTLATLKMPLTESWHTQFRLGRSYDDSDNFDKYGPEHSHFRTARNAAGWQNDFRLDDRQTLVAGVDYYEEEVEASGIFADLDGRRIDERDNTGYYLQYLLETNPVDLQLALRQDDHDSFGEETTGNAAVGFALTANLQLIASYGRGFRAPTFNDLYWPADDWSRGNPDLAPEKSENYEIELRAAYESWGWSLVGYHNQVENLINWAPVDPADQFGAWMPSNVDDAEIRGATLSADGELAGWLWRASFSYVVPRDEATDNVLVNRTRRTFAFDIDRDIGPWSLGASWLVRDHRYADTLNTRKLEGHGIVDLRLGYRVNEQWQLQLKIDNVFDRDYVLRENYSQERLTWFATVTYRL